jgi:hypothetical protein
MQNSVARLFYTKLCNLKPALLVCEHIVAFNVQPQIGFSGLQ